MQEELKGLNHIPAIVQFQNTSREQRHRYLDHLQNLLRARGNIVRILDIKRIEVKNKSTQINRDQFLTRVNVGYLDYRSREPSTSP
jgi:hypothetical protein